jgi:uncharacterized protein DUF3309
MPRFGACSKQHDAYPLLTRERRSGHADYSSLRLEKRDGNMLGTILIVILLLALCGALPRWPHSRNWGYYPTGGLGLILLIVVVLLLIGRI